ncbi:hypothetical protein PMAYCL1PPCAC_03986, partial [Pristionchus mayeri]
SDLLQNAPSTPGSAHTATAAATASAIAPSAAASSSSSSSDPLDAAKKRLAELVVQSAEHVSMKKHRPMTQAEKDEEECRKIFNKMQQPAMKRKIYAVRPALHDQYVKNPTDYEAFKREFDAYYADERKKLETMNNGFSAEGQALVMEQIRLENVERMYKEAFERMPEAFMPIHMLYIKIVVNGVPTFAFIDSGAQISIMSHSFAKQADLDRIIDTRVRKVVHGIGGADRQVGSIYCCEFEIGDVKFEAKVDVMNHNDPVLIGLDFMRRHRCCIDLARNRLTFTENTYAEFLSDAEINEFKKTKAEYVHHTFKVDDAKLAELMGMGFAKADAEDALK